MNSAGSISAWPFFRNRSDVVVFGKVRGSFFKKATLTELELNHHVHIVGASGFGKTVLLSHFIGQRISQGKGLMFIDLKGDIDTIETLISYAAVANRREDMKVISLAHLDLSCTYNLIGSGSATQLRDRIMLSLVWSEEFYRNQASSFLLKILIGLVWLRDNRGFDLDLASLSEMLGNRDKLEETCLSIPESELKVRTCLEQAVTSAKNQSYWESLQGLRIQIESIVLSDFGDLVRERPGGVKIFDAVRNGKLLFVFLDTRRYGETAKAVGRFILQDLKAASAQVDSEIAKNDRRPFSIVIDEFADIAQEDFIGFLDRARSSRMSLVVAHQEIADLERISPEFAARLMGNTATIYAFLQKRSESAELISGIAGTRTVERSTERHSQFLFLNLPTGEKSVREVEEYVVHPNVIKSLRVGECVCIKKYPFARAYRVKVAPVS